MEIISITDNHEYLDIAIKFFQDKWADLESKMVYEDCLKNSLDKNKTLPRWYLLYDEGELVGCAGLITNDFISRMDLYPWLCALFIEPEYRGRGYGELLINKAKEDSAKGGFDSLFLCTDFIGYYEQYGFEYIGDGYHPWGDVSRIYRIFVSE